MLIIKAPEIWLYVFLFLQNSRHIYSGSAASITLLATTTKFTPAHSLNFINCWLGPYFDCLIFIMLNEIGQSSDHNVSELQWAAPGWHKDSMEETSIPTLGRRTLEIGSSSSASTSATTSTLRACGGTTSRAVCNSISSLRDTSTVACRRTILSTCSKVVSCSRATFAATFMPTCTRTVSLGTCSVWTSLGTFSRTTP